jgi:plastocyanin
MLIRTAALALAMAATSAAAQIGDEKTVSVEVSNFRFMPHMIHLQAGQPVILRFINSAGEAHNFAAADFFRQAVLRQGDMALVKDGKVELGAHQTVEVEITPSAGQFSFKCTKPFHAALGMKGMILVQ